VDAGALTPRSKGSDINAGQCPAFFFPDPLIPTSCIDNHDAGMSPDRSHCHGPAPRPVARRHHPTRVRSEKHVKNR
jgi:hypothetical protein